MQRIICNRVYDTQTATLVKKVTFGWFGDPNGYEETLYKTEDGYFFFYTNGGATSKYTQEKLKRMSVQKANEWLSQNN